MNYEPWILGGAILGTVFVLGVLTTISNDLKEISRQLRNLNDDIKNETYGLGLKIEGAATQISIDLDRLHPTGDWDEPPPR